MVPPPFGRLVMAADHAPLGMFSELTDIPHLLNQCAEIGINHVIALPGVVRRHSDAAAKLGVSFIARLDGNETYLSGDWTSSPYWELLCPPASAAAYGASAGIVNLVLGGAQEMASIRTVSEAITKASAASLPIMVSTMILDRSSEISSPFSARTSDIVFGAYFAEQIGADAINLYSRGNAEAVQEIQSVCTVPLYVANFLSPMEPLPDLFIRTCIEASAAGFCVGEALWRSKDMRATADALMKGFLSSR